MTIFVGRECHTLIMEPSDVIAEQAEHVLKRFPGNAVSRVRTAAEALETLAINDPAIDQVCIDGRVWSIAQALQILHRL